MLQMYVQTYVKGLQPKTLKWKMWMRLLHRSSLIVQRCAVQCISLLITESELTNTMFMGETHNFV